MECVVTASQVVEDVLHVDATGAGDGDGDGAGAAVRFHVPQQVLDWAVGQRFLCAVGEDVAAPVILRGAVLSAAGAAGEALVSVGGLPVRLPLPGAKKDDAVRIGLTPLAANRKRPLRSRGASAGRAT